MTYLKLIGLVAALAVLSAPALAQGTENHTHDQHDHSAMDHSEMDHGDMEHAPVAAEPDGLEDRLVIARVNGLVCDFCARALERVFLREDAVSALTVDLDAGEVRVFLTANGEMSDARIGELIRDSGYSLVTIERSDGA